MLLCFSLEKVKATMYHSLMSNQRSIVADRIEQLLRVRDMSVADLCRESGVSESAISNILSGVRKQPRSDTVQKIAHGFRTSPDFLYGHTDDYEPRTAPPMPEYAQAVLERMREMDAHGNYIVRLLANSLSENKQQFRYISLMTVINWIIEEYGLSEEGEQLAELLERFERRVTRRLPAKEPGAQPVQPD